MRSPLPLLRASMRALLHSPGFTGAVVLTLALGIGANTTLFSLVSALMLRPLPLPEPHTLVSVWGRNAERPDVPMGLARPDVADLRAQARTLQHLAAYVPLELTLTGDAQEPARVQAAAVDPDLFPLLRVAPVLGRGLAAEEAVREGPRSAVLSHALWQRRFGGAAGVVGRTLEVDGEPYQVVGVMPPGFTFPASAAEEPVLLWVPLARAPFIRTSWDNRGMHALRAVGRLAPGRSAAAADRELDGVMEALARAHPDTNRGSRASVVPLQERLAEGAREPALMMLGAVALLLLIACVNVAQLLLARALARAHEFAVRAALGAGPGALARQLLAEGALLAALGGAGGVLLGAWGVGALRALLPGGVRGVQDVRLDGRALAYAGALSLLVVLVCGLAPLGVALRARLAHTLRAAPGAGAPRAALRWRAGLVAVQVALALVLLAGAGLLVRSAVRLAATHPGYRAAGVTAVPLELPRARYAQGPRWALAWGQLVERVRATPGVEAATAVSPGLVAGGGMMMGLRLVDQPDTGERLAVGFRALSDGGFAALGVPVLRGRDFGREDTATAPPVVVVNEAFVRRHLRDGRVLGARVSISFGPPTVREVVGVVADVRGAALDREPAPELYVPLAQTPLPFTTLLVRSRLPPDVLAQALRAELRALDPLLPLPALTTLEERLEASVADRRFQRVLFGCFAAAALGLAGLGIYGLMAYSVAQRRRELGIRLALGATRGSVLRLVVGQALRLALVGVAVGLALALGASRVLTGALYGVSATDPLTFAVAPLVLCAVVLVASAVPALRATRVAPGSVLGGG